MATPGIQTLCRKAHELIERGDIRRAGPLCERIVAEAPDYAAGWIAFSELWLRCARADRARECAERARVLLPDSAACIAQSAKCHLFDDERERARELAEQALNARPDSHGTLDTLGNVFSRLGDHERALAIFRRALELAPDNTTAMYNLATSLRFFGRVDEAERLFDRIIERDPDDYQALHSRSILRTQTEQSNHLPDLERRLAASPSWPAASHIAYALGKERDDLGQPRAAFDAYRHGADLMHRHLHDRSEQELTSVQVVTEALSDGIVERLRPGGHDSEEPVFVIGLPRAGSTLVERILGNHPDIHAAGELHNFQVELGKRLKTRSAAQAYRRLAEQPDALDPAELGRSYVASTRPATGDTPRFIDKLPRNDLWAPLIHRALPKARFILMQRHPMDVCYAMYRTLFNTGYHFSYDLEALGRYYLAWRRLCTQLRSVLPARQLLEVPYEDLVADPEEWARKLVAHCGLDWHPACLDTEQGDGAVVTASAHQVRRPVHTTSVGRWRSVSDRLEPLQRVLDDVVPRDLA